LEEKQGLRGDFLRITTPAPNQAEAGGPDPRRVN